MTIEAPYSKYTKKSFKIYMVVCIVFAAWFGYDGYLNGNFRKNHTDDNGKPDSTLVFNQKSPPFFIGAAVLLAAYLFATKNKKIIADESNLVIGKESIPCDSIEKIDKTYFDTKGFFIITYKDKNGNEVNRKLSCKTYDNLTAILDHLSAKIS